MTDQAMSPLRRRMIEDMTIRKFAPKTQHDYLRAFARIADLGSISGAARLLKMPKSSVSRSLIRLEEAVGVALVERSSRHNPPKATIGERSLRGQDQTHAPQQLVALVDHLLNAQLTIPPSFDWEGSSGRKHRTLQPRLAAAT